MDNTILELSKYRLERAKEDLRTAQNNFFNNSFSQSINRSYYSIFHSLRALLAFDRFDSRKHSGIISYFNQYYIKTGKFDSQYSKILKKAESLRIDSDYRDFFVPTREDAETQLQNAEEFVCKIEEYINTEILK